MKEEYNIWNVYNALSAFKKCHELFECERQKAKELCEVGLLETDVLQTAATIVIEQMKSALFMMQQGHFIAVASELAERSKQFELGGMIMYRLCPPISLLQTIQDLNSNKMARKFRSKGPRLCELFSGQKQGAKLTFERFKHELLRHGYLHKRRLHMTGKEIKSLYRFLIKEQIITPLPSMIAVFKAFKADFKLKIKSASSLQRIPDQDDEIDLWRNVFFMTGTR